MNSNDLCPPTDEEVLDYLLFGSEDMDDVPRNPRFLDKMLEFLSEGKL